MIVCSEGADGSEAGLDGEHGFAPVWAIGKGTATVPMKEDS